MMIEATEKFLVAKMALKILRMEMCPLRFRTICSDLLYCDGTLPCHIQHRPVGIILWGTFSFHRSERKR